MQRPACLLGFVLAALIAGCDTYSTLDAAEERQAATRSEAAFAKGAAPDVTVGGEVSVWDSGFDDPDPSDGIAAIGGSGQLNGEFTIAERDGIQIALRAQERFEGLLEATGTKVGVYVAETGTTRPAGSNNGTWNYDWHVDLRGTGTTLADYELTLHVANIANKLFGFQNPVDLTFGGAIPGHVVLYQQSWNPGFGNDEFDPTKEGTYTLRLRLKPRAGGPPLSVAIQVRVEDAA